MDISKELKLTKNNKKNFDKIYKEIHHQKEELDKKLHLMIILEAASSLESMIKDNLFKNSNVHSILINYKNDQIGLEFFNSKGEDLPVYKNNGDYIKPFDKLEDFFEALSSLDSQYIDESFAKNGHKKFELKSGAEDILIDLFLSSELKSVLNHSRLQNDLEHDNTHSHKKPKI